MKKRACIIWCVALLLSAVIASAVSLWLSRPCILPPEECSEVYRRYAGNPDVQAAYIKGYKVNDTLTLNATVLQALNDTGWASLREDFNIKPSHNDSTALAAGLDVLVLQLGFKFSDAIKADNDFATLSLRDRYICVFQNIEDSIKDRFIDEIWDKIFDIATNNQSLTNN